MIEPPLQYGPEHSMSRNPVETFDLKLCPTLQQGRALAVPLMSVTQF